VNRRTRRGELARYRQRSGGMLLTWLLDTADLDLAPGLLAISADKWLASLPRMRRRCFCCFEPLVDRRGVGALLLSRPAHVDDVATVTGLCQSCWTRPLHEIETAATDVLAAAVPGGKFADPVL